MSDIKELSCDETRRRLMTDLCLLKISWPEGPVVCIFKNIDPKEKAKSTLIP